MNFQRNLTAIKSTVQFNRVNTIFLNYEFHEASEQNVLSICIANGLVRAQETFRLMQFFKQNIKEIENE